LLDRRPATPALGLAALAVLFSVAWVAGGPALRATDAGPAALRPARPLLERVRSQLTGRAGLRADFTQVSEWAALGEADTSEGTLSVAASGLFRLDYRRPRGHRIGCDGARVWTFVPDERQVLCARVRQTTGWSGLFLESLEDPADSLASVVVTPDRGEVARIALRSRPEWELAALYIEIAVSPGRPVGYGYTDAEGNRICFRFRDARFVAEFPDTLFRFRVPSGYELFETD